MDDLRRRIGQILAIEDSDPPDWPQVERLTDELQQELEAEPDTKLPEVIGHYLDDSDIRARDEAYAAHQREAVRRFVDTGNYADSTPVPMWTCAVALAAVLGLIGWLIW